MKRPIQEIFAAVTAGSTVISLLTLQTVAAPIFNVVDRRLRDGEYYDSVEYLSPTYSITVKDGKVIDDASEDGFGCSWNEFGLRCSAKRNKDFRNFLLSLAKKNDYMFINKSQILRLTPDGKKVVLTWYKK